MADEGNNTVTDAINRLIATMAQERQDHAPQVNDALKNWISLKRETHPVLREGMIQTRHNLGSANWRKFFALYSAKKLTKLPSLHTRYLRTQKTGGTVFDASWRQNTLRSPGLCLENDF